MFIEKANVVEKWLSDIENVSIQYAVNNILLLSDVYYHPFKIFLISSPKVLFHPLLECNFGFI